MPGLPVNTLLTIQQAANQLGVSSKTLRRWEIAGYLVPQRTLGNQRRYTLEDLENLKHSKSSKSEIRNPKQISNFKFQISNSPFLPTCLLALLVFLMIFSFDTTPELSSFFTQPQSSPASITPANTSGQFRVLAAQTAAQDFTFKVNVPANFLEEATFSKAIISQALTAPNVIYSITAGSGISVSSGQTPTISNTGILSLTAGSGISVSGSTITNSGILSLIAGTGISVSGSTITNSDLGSSQYIFKTISVSGQSDIASDTNADTLTFAAGTGITLTTAASSDQLTITGASGWVDDGTTVRLETITNSVGIGTSSPSTALHVVGASTLAGAVTLGGAVTDTITFTGRIANNTAILPINDIGADLGSAALRFNNLYVANINSNQGLSTVGQATFTYPPTTTVYTDASVLINPTGPLANSPLLAVGIAGYERGRIDAEGDIILGYNGNISADVTSYPLSVYGHNTTRVAYIDTSGNAYFSGNVTGPDGGSIGYLQRASGALSPVHITDDILTGATATSSALIKLTGTSGNNSWINTGNVGIGTTSPSFKLEVAGNIGPTTADSSNLGSTTAEYNALYLGDDAGAYFGADQDWHLYYDETTDDRLELTTSGTTGMLISTAATTGTGLSLSANALTTGNAFYLESTSTAFSSGNLASLYWNPGSSTTATGDLLRLNVGSNGILGNLFNVLDNGSSIFSVSQTAITAGLPASFTSAGDVSLAYDLVFTNPNINTIRSLAPLNIEAGENFNSSNLTLKTFNEGTVVVDSAVSTGYGMEIDTHSLSSGVGLYVNSTGTITGDLANFTANSLTTGDVLEISATGLTSGTGLKFTGPTATGITGSVISLTSDVGSAGELVYLAPDFSGSAVTGYGLNIAATDATNNANTDYGLYSSLALTGNAAKTGTGLYSTVTSSSTTADTLAALDLAVSATGAITTGTRTIYGLRSQPASTGASSSTQTLNLYGSYLNPSSTLAIAGTTNVYGEYITSTATHNADAGTINQYGLYIANGTSSTNGTSTKYGLYVESPTGADTNFALYSTAGNNYFGGNVGIGTTNPVATFHVAATAPFVITSAGQVGIGTTAPASLLDVNGTAWLRGTGTSGLFVNSSGNVGIGTTAPDLPLHIYANTTGVTGFRVQQAGTGTGSQVQNVLQNDVGSLAYYGIASSNYNTFAPINGGSAFFGSNLTDTSIFTQTAKDIFFSTNAVEVMRIKSGGNVGIGTTGPAGKLDLTDTSNTAASLSLTNNTATTIGVGVDTLGVLDLQSTSLTTGNFLNLELNALTSGKGLNLTSTSTGLTGDLANITASGSNAAVTGSVLKVGLTGALSTGTALNVTSAGASGFALRVNDDGTYTDTTPFVVDYAGNVGIGTTLPGAKLDINGSLNIAGYATTSASLSVGYTTAPAGPGNAVFSGTVGIGTTAPGYSFQVVIDASNEGHVDSVGAWARSSDISFKTNIMDLEDSLGKVLALRPIRYDSVSGSTNHIGLIAQEVQNIFPEFISTDPNSGKLGLSYESFAPVLMKAIQEQQGQLSNFQNPISSFEFRVSNLEAKDASVSAELASLRDEIANLQINQFASPSANLSGLEDATVSGSLAVLGKTLLADLGVTGKLTIGLLAIDGLDAAGQASINTLAGPLKLQELALGNLEIMGGKIVMDTAGNLKVEGTVTAKKYNLDTSDVLGSAAGKVIIPAGETAIEIKTTALTENSLIFVTPEEPVSVSAKKTASDSAEIRLATPQTEPIKVNWWIVN